MASLLLALLLHNNKRECVVVVALVVIIAPLSVFGKLCNSIIIISIILAKADKDSCHTFIGRSPNSYYAIKL